MAQNKPPGKLTPIAQDKVKPKEAPAPTTRPAVSQSIIGKPPKPTAKPAEARSDAPKPKPAKPAEAQRESAKAKPAKPATGSDSAPKGKAKSAGDAASNAKQKPDQAKPGDSNKGKKGEVPKTQSPKDKPIAKFSDGKGIRPTQSMKDAMNYFKETLHIGDKPKAKAAAKAADAPSKKSPEAKPEQKAKLEQKTKPEQKPQDKPHTDKNPRSEESKFSLKNLQKTVIQKGNELIYGKDEPIVNKVKDANKLTVQERQKLGVDAYEDPVTKVRYRYNEGKLVSKVDPKNDLRTTYGYDKEGKPATVSNIKTDRLFGRSVGSAEAVDGKVALKINQQTGAAETSCHDKIKRVDPKTGKESSTEVKSQMFFHQDGSKSQLTSELNGRRLTKELMTADDKRTGTVHYQYSEGKDGRVINEAPVRAIEVGTDNRPKHVYDFQNVKALENDKAAAREDFTYTDKGPVNSEKREVYDLRSGKDVIVSRSEKSTDYQKGTSTVHEQKYDQGKLASDQTVNYDERAKATSMKLTLVNEKVDVSVKFDNNGKAIDVEGDYKHFADKKTMLNFATTDAGRAMAENQVTALDAGEMLAFQGPSKPREGTKPSGTIAWVENGKDTYNQATVENGIVFDGNGNKIGTANDKGDITINGKPSFNILTDKKYQAVFHGFGTDLHPLNLCATQSTDGKQRTEGMNGYAQDANERLLMVGGHMFSEDGKFVARVDANGKCTFAEGINQVAGTDLASFKSGDFAFKGNENGNERRFLLDSASNGEMFIQQRDANGKQILDASGKPVPPTACEVRLGMVIDKQTQKQLYVLIPPEVKGDSFTGGALISMGDHPTAQALTDSTGTSFQIKMLGNSQATTLRGIATGPVQLQADGTPVPGTGGIVNLDKELKLETETFQASERTFKDNQKSQDNARTAGLVLGGPVTGVGAVEGYLNWTSADDQLAADKTAYDLATKQFTEQKASIDRILTTGQIDNNTLYKLQSGNERVRDTHTGQLARLQRMIDNPQHNLESVSADSDGFKGTIKRPDLKNPGQMLEYSFDKNLVYKKGTDQVVGNIDPKDGTLKIYDSAGRVQVSQMNDPRLAGTVIQMQFDKNGKQQNVDWLNDGSGKLQSFAEMRKQAANERQYVELLAGSPNSTERAKEGLERTKQKEARFNTSLNDMLKNGVRDITVDAQGRVNPGENLRKVLEGPKKTVRAESFLIDEKAPPKKISKHEFNTKEDCQKASGPMRVGSELYYCDKGQLFLTKEVNGKPVPTGEPVGSLEPGYVAQIGNRRVELRDENQFLFQFKLEGDNSEHRILGTGKPHLDGNGNFVPGGLVDAKELMVGALDAQNSADKSMEEYFYEKPGGNVIADKFGWTVNQVMGDRDAQMRYVRETMGNQRTGMNQQIDQLFNEGFTAQGMTNNHIDHNVSSISRTMRDLNLSAGDMDSLSMEGRSMYKQSAEGVTMVLTSAVPGGIGLAVSKLGARSLLATSHVARYGLAFTTGGAISTAFRQSEKNDALTTFGLGGAEAMVMLGGAEAADFLQNMQKVHAAKVLNVGEKFAPAVQAQAESAAGKFYLNMMSKPGGPQAVEILHRLANAGFQSSALTLTSSIREGNYDQLTPMNLAKGAVYMLAADIVAMGAATGPRIEMDGKLGKALDTFISGVGNDAANNVANTWLSARVQAEDVEKQYISKEHHIPIDMISPELFEQLKNESRMQAYMVDTIANALATSLFTGPMGHAMQEKTQQNRDRVARTWDPNAPTETRRPDVHLTREDLIEHSGLRPDVYLDKIDGNKTQILPSDATKILPPDAMRPLSELPGDRTQTMHLKEGTPARDSNDGSVRKPDIYLTSDHVQSMHKTDADVKQEQKTRENLLKDVADSREHLEGLITKTVADPVLANRMKTDIDIMMERIIVKGMDTTEFTKTIEHVTELLSDNPNAQMNLMTRQRIAEEALWLAAQPTYLSQGGNPTCTVAAGEVRQYISHPSEVVGALKDLALTGEFKCPDGTILKPFTAGGDLILHPDADAVSHYADDVRSGRVDGKRLLASQMYQTLQVAARYAHDDSYNGHNIGKGNIGYVNNRLVDMSNNPPLLLTKIQGPDMNGSDLIRAIKQLTGREENVALTIKQNYETTKESHHFETIEEMSQMVMDLFYEGKLPVAFSVDASNPPFNRSGRHMITITDMSIRVDPSDPRPINEIIPRKGEIDPATGKQKLPHPDDILLKMDNQWTTASDYANPEITLGNLFLASLNKPYADRMRIAMDIMRHIRKEGSDGQEDRFEFSNSPEEYEKWKRASEDLAEKAGKKPRDGQGPLAEDNESFVKDNEVTDVQPSPKPAEVKEPVQPKPPEKTLDQRLQELAAIVGDKNASQEARTEAMREVHKIYEDLQRAAVKDQKNHGKEQSSGEDGVALTVKDIDEAIQLYKDATLDKKVTGTLNEFGFEVKLAAALDANKPVTVAFIDLNNFKTVNTEFSRDMGDRALQEFGNKANDILKAAGISEEDAYVGHFGGDEYGILLTGKGVRKQKEVFEKLQNVEIHCKTQNGEPQGAKKGERNCDFDTVEVDKNKRLSKDRVKPAGDTVVVTATLGAVQWKPGFAKQTSDGIMQAADKVMFVKKDEVKERRLGGHDINITVFDKGIQEHLRGKSFSETEDPKVRQFLDINAKKFEEYKTARIDTVNTEFNRERAFLLMLANDHRHLGTPSQARSINAVNEKFIKSGEPFTVIRLSIDNFKQVNDKFESHAKGNEVLKALGEHLRTVQEKHGIDFLGCDGGTAPFLVVKDASKVQEIKNELDKFFIGVTEDAMRPLKSFEDANIQAREIPVGFSAIDVKWQPGMTAESLLHTANEQLKRIEADHIDAGRHTRRGRDRRFSDLNSEQIESMTHHKMSGEAQVQKMCEQMFRAGRQFEKIEEHKNARLQETSAAWRDAYDSARAKINKQHPGLLPELPANGNAPDVNVKDLREKLAASPELLPLLNNAYDAYKQHKLAYAVEVNAPRRANAERLNQVLAKIAEAHGEPVVTRIHATPHNLAEAAYQIGTGRIFVSEDALSGNRPLNRMVKDLNWAYFQQTQHNLVVRNMANELGLPAKPTEHDMAKLQAHYKKVIGKELEAGYATDVLKGHRDVTPADQKRAHEMEKSFKEAVANDNLRQTKRFVDRAFDIYEHGGGAGDIMKRAIFQNHDIPSIVENSWLKDLFPTYSKELLTQLVTRYVNEDGWSAVERELNTQWHNQLRNRQSSLRDQLAEHDKAMNEQPHMLESDAHAELAHRYMTKKHVKHWAVQSNKK